MGSFLVIITVQSGNQRGTIALTILTHPNNVIIKAKEISQTLCTNTIETHITKLKKEPICIIEGLLRISLVIASYHVGAKNKLTHNTTKTQHNNWDKKTVVSIIYQ